jgi:hypothetical protein
MVPGGAVGLVPGVALAAEHRQPSIAVVVARPSRSLVATPHRRLWARMPHLLDRKGPVMTRPTTRRTNYRISRRMSAIHRAHATAPHLGCVLCMTATTPTR